ncbi:HD domain-containing phosphohydrolase [Shewanella psychrotolerans]|uniref:HD domain-containing phosphohydrolase n=1 Tax=Shewanella psychrotolerans TaxID=2864206 RepID=UPI001C65F308|nr:HD-GYP domain-containing protein [Shewanella psychrotolerans]QYK00405.1 HD-GYP domain-containing protein [Shewanella psychrotolerans]
MNHKPLDIGQHSSAMNKLVYLHLCTQEKIPEISRIAVALYDHDTDKVKTFIYSGKPSPLNHYEAKLCDCYSLNEIATSNNARIEQDLRVFCNSKHRHAQLIYEAGYRSSYTIPVIYSGEMLGFIFFNADIEDVFDQRCIEYLDLIGNLLALILINELSEIKTLASTMQTAIDVTHFRDPETAEHLSRMSHYSRLIILKVADIHQLNDHFAEHVFLFAPLHDIGKITVPDSILFKPGPLTTQERQEMQKHCQSGLDLIDKLLNNYHLNNLDHTQILRNIVMYHHETLDGQGYPSGLMGNDIPIEARVVAVADIFDALTSVRPYKKAWSNQEAYAELEKLAGTKLDRDCVNALINAHDEVMTIQATFSQTQL